MIIGVALSLALQTAPLVVDVKGVKKPAPRPAVAAAVIEAGRRTYAARCAGCHGTTGNSDGPVGKALRPSPQRFTDALWQARVTDDEIMTATRDGGAAVKRSPTMPAHKDLTPENLAAVAAFLRTLRAPHGTASVTVMLADGRDATAAADADASGSARVTFNNVAGKVTVLGVVDETGAPMCQVEVAEAAGATVRCAKEAAK